MTANAIGFGLLVLGGLLAAALLAACAAYNRRGRRLFGAWRREGKGARS